MAAAAAAIAAQRRREKEKAERKEKAPSHAHGLAAYAKRNYDSDAASPGDLGETSTGSLPPRGGREGPVPAHRRL